MILQCKCGDFANKGAEFQNKEYGYGMRVCNVMKSETDARCTVCEEIHRSVKTRKIKVKEDAGTSGNDN